MEQDYNSKRMQKQEDLEAQTERTSPEAHRAVAGELLLSPSTSLWLPLDTLPPTASLEKSDFIITKSQSLKQVSFLLQMESCPGAETCLLG